MRFINPFTFSIALIVLIFAGLFAFQGVETSTGSREAKLLKLSNKGLFVKSWEGQLGIFATGEDGALNPFEFTVRDHEVAEQLAEHVGDVVEIHYREFFTHNPFRYSTSYDVTSFDIAGQ